MPLRSFSQNRNERRVALLLYVASLVLLLALLKATYNSMLRYADTTAEVRTLNLALIDLESLLSDLRDQETATRGYILTNDSTYLDPYNAALLNYGGHLAEVDSLLSRPHWRPFVGILHMRVEEVETGLSMMLIMNNRDGRMQPGEAQWLDRAKLAMDNAREAYVRLSAQLRVERDVLVERERAVGTDAPEMILFYSVMAVLATAILFWLLFHALRKKEVAKRDLQLKVVELAGEVGTRTSVQRMLQKVLDTSPNSIMAFRSVRDGAGRVIDFRFLAANREASTLLKRSDLEGKLWLAEVTENATLELFHDYVSLVETGTPFQKELNYRGRGMDRWFFIHAVRLDDGFMVTSSDITEQKHAQDINAETERIALTGQITRTVAHEVRNPLTNIHLAMEQLHDEVRPKEDEVKPFFQIIDRNLKRIGALINGMLESSRKRELDLATCRFEDIVNSAMEHAADRMELKGMKGLVDIAPGLPDVMVDHELMDLAITNIAVNAMEAMEAGKGQLTMRAYGSDDEVLIEITDNGKGIPPENLGRLFEPFYSGRPGGLGLGLTATRTILNSHRVKLDVRSKVGEGTTFTLRFPQQLFVERATDVDAG